MKKLILLSVVFLFLINISYAEETLVFNLDPSTCGQDGLLFVTDSFAIGQTITIPQNGTLSKLSLYSISNDSGCLSCANNEPDYSLLVYDGNRTVGNLLATTNPSNITNSFAWQNFSLNLTVFENQKLWIYENTNNGYIWQQCTVDNIPTERYIFDKVLNSETMSSSDLFIRAYMDINNSNITNTTNTTNQTNTTNTTLSIDVSINSPSPLSYNASNISINISCLGCDSLAYLLSNITSVINYSSVTSINLTDGNYELIAYGFNGSVNNSSSVLFEINTSVVNSSNVSSPANNTTNTTGVNNSNPIINLTNTTINISNGTINITEINITDENGTIETNMTENETNETDFWNKTKHNSCISIKHKKITVDTNNCPWFVRAAILRFYHIDLKNPRIMRDGKECKKEDGCWIVNYNKNTGILIIHVPHFSEYEIVETPVTSSSVVHSSGGGGGGGGNSFISIKSADIKLSPGKIVEYEPIRNTKLNVYDGNNLVYNANVGFTTSDYTLINSYKLKAGEIWKISPYVTLSYDGNKLIFENQRKEYTTPKASNLGGGGGIIDYSPIEPDPKEEVEITIGTTPKKNEIPTWMFVIGAFGSIALIFTYIHYKGLNQGIEVTADETEEMDDSEEK